jgi:hypothetical protein
MKHNRLFIIGLATLACAVSAKTPAPKPKTSATPAAALTQPDVSISAKLDVSNLSVIRANLVELKQVVDIGPVSEALNNPALVGSITAALDESVANVEDELAAQRRLNAILEAGGQISKEAAERHAARMSEYAERKEAALMKVKDTNPSRAKSKMEEYLDAGVNISKKTQNAVNAAQPPPPPSPTPTPGDGLD